MMDFDYSEMQQMLVDSAARVIADHYGLEAVRHQRSLPNGLNAHNWQLFAKLGWLALPLPEDAGGLGSPFQDVVVLATMLGRGLAVEPYVSTVVIGGHLLASLADPVRRGDLLAGIAAGEVRVALAHGEPGERFGDGGARQVTARASGNGFVLGGRKMLVMDAPSATHLVVTATVPDGDLALFVVPADAGGLATVEAYPLVDGSMAADLALDGVAVAANGLLAQGASAEALLGESLDRAAVAAMAQAVGSMEACLEVCSAYLKERQQFGQPLGKFQALQHKMADMLVATHQSRSILYHALANLEADRATRESAVSLAKVLIGEAAQQVSRAGIQLHGGYGITDEYIISHHFRRLMVLEKQFGDIAAHSDRRARILLGPVA